MTKWGNECRTKGKLALLSEAVTQRRMQRRWQRRSESKTIILEIKDMIRSTPPKR